MSHYEINFEADLFCRHLTGGDTVKINRDITYPPSFLEEKIKNLEKEIVNLHNENKHLKDKIQHLNKQYAKWRNNFCEAIASEILRRESEIEEEVKNDWE